MAERERSGSLLEAPATDPAAGEDRSPTLGGSPEPFLRRLRTEHLPKLLKPQMLIITVVVVVMAYLAIVPLLFLLLNTFFVDSSFTFESFGRAYRAYGITQLASNSFIFSLGATAISVGLGTLLAYLVERTDIYFKRLVFLGALVPLVIPGILYTIAWIFLGSPRIGIINRFFEPILGGPLFDVFSMFGMILVQGMDNVSLAFLLMVAAFRSMDPSLEESALTSGARLPGVFRRVTLPLALPSVLAAVLIMTVRNLESFETPALLGIPSNIWVFTSRIWQVLSGYPPDFGQAGAYSLSLLVLTGLGLWYYYRLLNRGKRYQTVTGKGYRTGSMSLGRWRTPMTVLVLLYFFVAVLLPFLVLLYASTQPFYGPPSLEAFDQMTLDSYRYLWENPQTVRAFRNSFILAFATATLVMLFCAVASWLVVRTKLPGRWLIDNLTFLPLVLPGLVLGVALLIVYVRIPVAIYGTLWILLVSYCTRNMPYGMRYVSASMYQIGSELEESAQVSGASWWQIFRRIILPLLMPGLVAGWLYIVMTAVRELSSSILLYSPGSEVLSIVIWEQWENAQITELAALGVTMIGLLAIVIFATRLLTKRWGVRGSGSTTAPEQV